MTSRSRRTNASVPASKPTMAENSGVRVPRLSTSGYCTCGSPWRARGQRSGTTRRSFSTRRGTFATLFSVGRLELALRGAADDAVRLQPLVGLHVERGAVGLLSPHAVGGAELVAQHRQALLLPAHARLGLEELADLD